MRDEMVSGICYSSDHGIYCIRPSGEVGVGAGDRSVKAAAQ